MSIRIDRPSLNRETEKANLAIVDKWIADTSDKLNHFVSQLNVGKAETDARLDNIAAKVDQISEQVLYIRADLMQVEEKIISLDKRVEDLEKGVTP